MERPQRFDIGHAGAQASESDRRRRLSCQDPTTTRLGRRHAGRSAAWLARKLWVLEVPGSNPGARANESPQLRFGARADIYEASRTSRIAAGGGLLPRQGDSAGQPTSPASIVATKLSRLTPR